MAQTGNSSTWGPLREPVFRALWIAAVASNVGTWMQNIGAEWLMTTLAPFPVMVALMQTAENSPTFLLGLPAGALADIVDRRRLLLVTQAWMLLAATALGVLTLAGLTTSWILLALTFVLGLGSAMNAPAWQAIVPEIVERSELPAAISLNSVAFNIARAIGPALGGFLVAAIGSGAVFLLNAASFVGVMLVLYRWRRTPVESISPTERVLGAMRAGLRYVRHAPELQAVLVRTAAFVTCASALWAMLPLFARQELGRGALGYGVLLGGLGSGAVLAATVLNRLRQRLSPEQLTIAGTILFAAVTAAIAYIRVFPLVFVAMVAGGIAWMTLMSGFNTAVQTVVPSWVRARALAVYLFVFFGGMAAGSAVWGAIAGQIGIPRTLLCAAAALVAGLLTAFRFQMKRAENLDLEPSLHWSDPAVVIEPHPEHGPVLVVVEYRIDPTRAIEFIAAMDEMKTIVKRDGASRWGLFNDPGDPARYVETFLVESWAEHIRQHARITGEDRAVQEHVRSFHVSDSPPVVSHLIAAQAASRTRLRDLARRLRRGPLNHGA